jgi:hypothetical protein
MKKYGAPSSVVTDGFRAYCAAMNEIRAADRHEVGRRLNAITQTLPAVIFLPITDRWR